MSRGSPEESQRPANQYVRSALTTGVVSTLLLGGLYLFGGKELLESSRRFETVLETQESDQKQIRDNSTIVGVVQQRLEDVLNAEENQRVSYEEMRKRVVELEKMLTSILRRTDETRHEIDAAASRKALKNAETIAVTALADECEQALSKMKTLTVSWETEAMPLLTNDRGRQLASDEKTLQTFMVATTGKFPTVKNSIDWLAEYQEVVDPLKNAEAQGIKNFSTIFETHTFLESLLTKTNEANQRLERRRRAVEVILATTSEHDSSDLTLAEGIKNAEDQQLKSRLEKAIEDRASQLKKVIEEQADAFIATQKKLILAEGSIKRQKEDMRTNAVNRESEDLSKDEAIAQEKARKIQLEKEFVIELSEINRLLGTFLGKGSNQPVPNYSLDLPQWQLVGLSLGPISLGRLASIGALDQTETGYELLYHIGGDSRNDRSKTGFPQYTNKGAVNPTVMAKVKRASELLNKYGELLVKKRLLLP